ncbi:hypothetical protein I4U23_000639 [Adineta vaga]|nr:hypothetical protein I4U23_000639 [Adineta vaga]
MQHELTNFVTSLRNGHKSIRQINKMMDSLINEIESANSAELKTILKSVKEIAKRYRSLESDTVSLVKSTSVVCEDVRMAVQGALDDELTTTEAFESMSKDFEGLSNRTLLTVVTPLFAAWAVRCAILGSGWSETFQDLSDQILSVEAAINDSALHLMSIRSMLDQLDEKVSKCDVSKSTESLQSAGNSQDRFLMVTGNNHEQQKSAQ